MRIALFTRIVFSILSGIGVGLIQVSESDFYGLVGEMRFYALSGLVFAAGVLLPYIERGNRLMLRALALIIASGISYYAAVWFALDGPLSGEGAWISFVFGSIAGAAIVLFAFVLTTSARATREFLLYGLVAALIGGPVTWATLPKGTMLVLTGHATWHTLMCLAIYLGTRKRREADIAN